jgi:hypothetical protein
MTPNFRIKEVAQALEYILCSGPGGKTHNTYLELERMSVDELRQWVFTLADDEDYDVDDILAEQALFEEKMSYLGRVQAKYE